MACGFWFKSKETLERGKTGISDLAKYFKTLFCYIKHKIICNARLLFLKKHRDNVLYISMAMTRLLAGYSLHFANQPLLLEGRTVQIPINGCIRVQVRHAWYPFLGHVGRFCSTD